MKPILLIVFIGIANILIGQEGLSYEDSTRSYEILNSAGIESNNLSVSENTNVVQLNLTQNEALVIIKNVLFWSFGKVKILRQKPFHIVKLGKYYVAWGSLKKGKRGVFEIVLNSEDSCVEFLSHGK